ncbi:uncharacterized protein F5147DRAFT_657969 [Suillus discolor]|uniref:Fungal-type protein kinase domain-containing protein n=1 Tax=Suillus discolor TaxID=1912936 RepID=A0A9P7EUK8_9AGAM|nr:uncharacterized protein F5147DRAFT_657969 [Suillus discolor]KAG2091185.1 hypothetical protein F5147DRAFT_657969 [Suillus discolor]
MPFGKHFCSVGLRMKLASLMSAPEVHDVTTMDRLTSSELIRLILQESSPANSDELGHVLLLIFKSCMTEVPKAKDLKVPLKKIHPDTRIEAFQHIEDEATLIPLYDTRACCWNWPLPESHLDKLATSGERSNQAGENSSTDQGEREGENSGAANQRSGDWVIVDDTDTPAASESQVESVGQPEDDVFASFNNLLTFALLLQKPALAQKCNLSRIWSTSNSSSAIRGDEIACKPALTILDDIEVRWDTIKATAEAIPDVLIMESKTTEIEEIMSEPPHTIEDAVPNPTANIPPNPVPLIDKVPSDSLSEPLPEPIGKIRVNENMYDILDLIFSTEGLVGCGTVCYLARKDEEEYIVKDHWVLRSKSEVLNEIRMMEKMDGICGVPRLVEYWLVEMEPGEVNETVKYRQKVSRSIKGTSQFLTSILDIIKIQKQAVEQNRVLHHDCSLNNAMIEDNGDGTHGMLIDWEFAVEIVRGDQYGVGGTGTVPFMSRSLLFQLYLHTPDPSDERLGTRASGSKPYPPPMVTHVYQDDLESMFYVFIWVCIEFRGPLSMKHIAALPKEDSAGLLVSKWVILSAAGSLTPPRNDEETQTNIVFHLFNGTQTEMG